MSRKFLEIHKASKPHTSGRKEKAINPQDEIARWLGQRLKAALEATDAQIKASDRSSAARALVD